MKTLKKLALPLMIASLFVGVGVGLFLGWQIWPVQWFDTDPSDMRVQHQQTWIVMTADSLAVTGNTQLARQRLYELVDDNTNWNDIANFIEAVAQQEEIAGNAAAATRLRRMAAAAQLPPPGEAPVEPEPAAVSTPMNWIVLVGAVAIFLVALGIVIYLLVRIGGRQPGRAESPEPRWEEQHPLPPPEVRSVEGPEWEEGNGEEEGYEEDLGYEEDYYAEEEPVEEYPLDEDAESWIEPSEISLPDQASETAAGYGRVEAEVAEREHEPEAGPAYEGYPDALGAFEAEYRYGDDDFDCSFSIEAANGDFLGEVGVSIGDAIRGDEAQKVDAFEVWLFDKGDIRTVSKILVSEHVAEDEALNARLSAKGDLVVVEPGMTVMLETLSLQATATVTGYDYLDDPELPNSIFSRLNVELIVEPADA